MNLADLVARATDKEKFKQIEDYIAFCARYLEYIETGLQARIVSRNENHYEFFQYRKDGYSNITRPLNSKLMYSAGMFLAESERFLQLFERLRDGEQPQDNLFYSEFPARRTVS